MSGTSPREPVRRLGLLPPFNPGKAFILALLLPAGFSIRLNPAPATLGRFFQARDTFRAIGHAMGGQHVENVIGVLQKKRPPPAHGAGRDPGDGP